MSRTRTLLVVLFAATALPSAAFAQQPPFITVTQPPMAVPLSDAPDMSVNVAGAAVEKGLIDLASGVDVTDPAVLLVKAATFLVYAAQNKMWRPFFGVAILLFVILFRRFAPKPPKPGDAVATNRLTRALQWFNTDRGAVVLSFILGPLAAVGTGLLSKQFSYPLLIDGVMHSLTAMGAFAGVKRLLWPKDTAAAQPPAAPTGTPLGPRLVA